MTNWEQVYEHEHSWAPVDGKIRCVTCGAKDAYVEDKSGDVVVSSGSSVCMECGERFMGSRPSGLCGNCQQTLGIHEVELEEGNDG